MRGRHKSLDKDLKRSILWLEGVAGVTKIVIGISECCRHKYPPGHIKIQMDVSAGIKAKGYSGKGVTDLFIRVNPLSKIKEVRQAINDKFFIA